VTIAGTTQDVPTGDVDLPGDQRERTPADAAAKDTAANDTAANDTAAKDARASTGQPTERSPDDEQLIRELQTRDREVRAHEAAHAAIAGQFGGGISYDYETGPDGKRYAVGGEVSVRLERGRTPQETIRNAQQVRASALAPMSPSSQDRAVAAAASQMENEARMELLRADLQSRTRDERADAARRAERAAESGERPSREPATATESASKHEPVVTLEPERAIERLQREQTARFGGQSHAHALDSCGFCSSAVSAYRQAST
jgi:hypothetical protein